MIGKGNIALGSMISSGFVLFMMVMIFQTLRLLTIIRIVVTRKDYYYGQIYRSSYNWRDFT